jgi:hypothetical protein
MSLVTRNNSRRTLDLSGPDGNAFALMGYAREWGKQLGWTKQEIDEAIKDMMAGTYKELVEEFDAHFGSFVDLVLPKNWEGNNEEDEDEEE